MTRILALAGSARRDSLNEKLARVAARCSRTQVAVSGAGTAFDATGTLTDPKVAKAVQALTAALVEATRKLEK